MSFFVHEKAKKRFKKTRKSVLHSSGLGENDKKRPRGDDDRTTEREGEKDGEHGSRRGRQDRRRASER